jgi:hypothetical protein
MPGVRRLVFHQQKTRSSGVVRGFWLLKPEGWMSMHDTNQVLRIFFLLALLLVEA